MISRHGLSLLFPSTLIGCPSFWLKQFWRAGMSSDGLNTASTLQLHDYLSKQMVQSQQQHRHCTIADILPDILRGDHFDLHRAKRCPLSIPISFCVSPAQLCCTSAVAYGTVHGSRWLEQVAASSITFCFMLFAG